MNNENTVKEILHSLKEKVAKFEPSVSAVSHGKVLKVGDGVAKISGLSGVKAFEILDMSGTKGIAVNLETSEVGAVILGEETKVLEGAEVSGTGAIAEFPVGDELLGRVVSPIGEILDGKTKPTLSKSYPYEKIAPGVMQREPVSVPLSTGIKIIDALIPIGRGQRELIIGDRGTGKTAIAIDTIVNQTDQDVVCIYVSIGQKESKVRRIVKELEERGAMKYTTVIMAGASDPSTYLYLAPFAGAALAEYFMDQGKDVLVIYDDLSKHAVAYREISLLLRRPPGREAYPGDVFYLHSRLLERACRRNEQSGGGSVTALPIIETQAGDISAYIPTNVISITDGQIFLETDLFYQGVRPAVNTGLSVSRVGSAAQTKIMKKSAGKLKLYLAQYRELKAFAQFGSDLDEETKNELERGEKLTEMLKQPQYSPIPHAIQVVMFYAASKGLLGGIPTARMPEFESKLSGFLKANHKNLLLEIDTKRDLTEEIEENLKKAIEEYKNAHFS